MKRNLFLLLFISFLCTASSFKEQNLNKDFFKTITIGKQTWMAENYNAEMPRSWYYNRDSITNKKYGRLYMWSNAMMAAPKGWHLPSLNEWQQLINYFGGDSSAAPKLLEGGKSGMNLLLCGHRSANISTNEIFDFKDLYGYYWTSRVNTDIKSNQFAYAIEFRKGRASVVKNYFRKANGFGVRYVKDK